jgi:hypothetical protein
VTANVQTYQMSGGIGLARMAMHLAGIREWGEHAFKPLEGAHPLSRDDVGLWDDPHTVVPFSAEYYAILDRVSRGEQP